jgi:hypothetical protein
MRANQLKTTMAKTKKPKFEIGDSVCSSADSSDVRHMRNTWHAVVVARAACPGTPDDHVYITAGWWEHAVDMRHGFKVLEKYVDRQRVRAAQRQLWCDTLQKDTSRFRVSNC